MGAFNPAAGAGLMCRDTVSVAWDGRVYDCDFNQQLAIPATGAISSSSESGGSGAASSGGEWEGGGPAGGSSDGGGNGVGVGPSVFDVNSLDELTGWRVAVGNHCFGCMAGSGSSCQGATA